jgi:hypothetical protein
MLDLKRSLSLGLGAVKVSSELMQEPDLLGRGRRLRIRDLETGRDDDGTEGGPERVALGPGLSRRREVMV